MKWLWGVVSANVLIALYRHLVPRLWRAGRRAVANVRAKEEI